MLVGIKATPSSTPLSQVYVAAPPPLRVISSPVHTAVLVEFAVTIGNGFTVKVYVCVAALQGEPNGLSVVMVMFTVFPASVAAGV